MVDGAWLGGWKTPVYTAPAADFWFDEKLSFTLAKDYPSGEELTAYNARFVLPPTSKKQNLVYKFEHHRT